MDEAKNRQKENSKLATKMDATIRSAEMSKAEHKTNVKRIIGTGKNSYRLTKTVKT